MSYSPLLFIDVGLDVLCRLRIPLPIDLVDLSISDLSQIPPPPPIAWLGGKVCIVPLGMMGFLRFVCLGVTGHFV